MTHEGSFKLKLFILSNQQGPYIMNILCTSDKTLSDTHLITINTYKSTVIICTINSHGQNDTPNSLQHWQQDNPCAQCLLPVCSAWPPAWGKLWCDDPSRHSRSSLARRWCPPPGMSACPPRCLPTWSGMEEPVGKILHHSDEFACTVKWSNNKIKLFTKDQCKINPNNMQQAISSCLIESVLVLWEQIKNYQPFA